MKTPVMILQEIMTKGTKLPHYDLIYEGHGTHKNTFTYRVTCDSLSAEGSGSSKKDAKHKAAEAMLQIMGVYENVTNRSEGTRPPAEPVPGLVPLGIPTTLRAPVDHPIFTNSVGALLELCKKRNIEDPKFEVTKIAGPPHAQTFTMNCILAGFRVEAVAKTKKQAKHDAARKMLEHLSEHPLNESTLPGVTATSNRPVSAWDQGGRTDDGITYMELPTEELKLLTTEADEAVKAIYQEYRSQTVVKKNTSLYVDDYHRSLKDKYDEGTRLLAISKCEKFIQTVKDFGPCEAYRLFTATLSMLQLKYKKLFLNKQNKMGNIIVAIVISNHPDIIELGCGIMEEEAELNAIMNTVKTLIVLLR